MKVSREQAAENRTRIVDTASRLFRGRGFAGVGVADLMRAAGLTHGGFYGHFASKDDLAAAAMERALAEASGRWTAIVAAAPAEPLQALAARYLSERHRDAPESGCALAALAGDAARGGRPLRVRFGAGAAMLAGILAGIVEGRGKAGKRRAALAALSEMVGALVLARAVDDPAFSHEILDAARIDLVRHAPHRDEG